MALRAAADLYRRRLATLHTPWPAPALGAVQPGPGRSVALVLDGNMPAAAAGRLVTALAAWLEKTASGEPGGSPGCEEATLLRMGAGGDVSRHGPFRLRGAGSGHALDAAYNWLQKLNPYRPDGANTTASASKGRRHNSGSGGAVEAAVAAYQPAGGSGLRLGRAAAALVRESLGFGKRAAAAAEALEVYNASGPDLLAGVTAALGVAGAERVVVVTAQHPMHLVEAMLPHLAELYADGVSAARPPVDYVAFLAPADDDRLRVSLRALAEVCGGGRYHQYVPVPVPVPAPALVVGG